MRTHSLAARLSARHLATLLLTTLSFATGCPGFGSETGEDTSTYPARPVFADVEPVLDLYCNECHGVPPTQDAPAFLRLDTCEEQGGVPGAKAYVERIVGRTVHHDVGPMPPADYPLQPAEAEDELLIRWRDLGAPCTEAELPPVDATADAGHDPEAGQ